jgi:hypothetical protein
VIGGRLDTSETSAATYAFSMSTGEWRMLTFGDQSIANGTLPDARWFPVFEALSDTKIILYGGEYINYDSDGDRIQYDTSDVWIFDVKDESWHRVVTAVSYTRAVTQSCVINGRLLVVHGIVSYANGIN